jgi:two-component system sensor histidine kinase KdpD
VLEPLSDSINQKPLGQDVYFSLLSLKEIFFILMVTFTSIILARIAEVYVGVDDLSIIFIVAVLLVATKTRMLAAVITAMLFLCL